MVKRYEQLVREVSAVWRALFLVQHCQSEHVELRSSELFAVPCPFSNRALSYENPIFLWKKRVYNGAFLSVFSSCEIEKENMQNCVKQICEGAFFRSYLWKAPKENYWSLRALKAVGGVKAGFFLKKKWHFVWQSFI